jgi:dipeptidyl aminopeptidase/acylaminoacyl peptidase
MGGSFGAYLALCGVAAEHSPYRCAVCVAGVFDWEMILNERKAARYDLPSYDRMLRKLGDPKQQADRYAAISPLRHIDRVHVPVFVAHGKDDPVVEITESKRLVAELERFHVPYEKYFVSGEGHGMHHVSNEVELYSRIAAFLAQNLAPADAVASH